VDHVSPQKVIQMFAVRILQMSTSSWFLLCLFRLMPMTSNREWRSINQNVTRLASNYHPFGFTTDSLIPLQ
jgi:hypothetical protein